jgi:hypothetical protein
MLRRATDHRIDLREVHPVKIGFSAAVIVAVLTAPLPVEAKSKVDRKRAITVAQGILAVDRLCPAYRANREALSKYMAEADISASDIAPPVDVERILQGFYADTKNCDLAFRTHGKSGMILLR